MAVPLQAHFFSSSVSWAAMGAPLGCRCMGRFFVGRGRLFAGVVGVVAVSLALPALAQTDPTGVSGNELADGTWTGWFKPPVNTA